MMKLCIFVGITAGGLVGYLVPASWGFFWAFVVSGIGSVFGVYFGCKLGRWIER